MKFNKNYWLIGFLVFILLYCCLGNNLMEGLTSDTAVDVQNAGKKEATAGYNAYQSELKGEGLNDYTDQSTNNAPPRNGAPKCNSSNETWSVDKKKCISQLHPDSTSTDDSCDTGYVWNKISAQCIKNKGSSVAPSAPGSASNANCKKGTKWDMFKKKCISIVCGTNQTFNIDQNECIDNPTQNQNGSTQNQNGSTQNQNGSTQNQNGSNGIGQNVSNDLNTFGIT
jgi:hypothetical protein